MEPTTKKRKSTAEDDLLKLACQKLGSSDNASSSLAKGWATQYEEMSKEQKVFSRTIISDVLFHGCLGKLTEKTVEDIHKDLKGFSAPARIPYIQTDDYLSRTSTPYMDE